MLIHEKRNSIGLPQLSRFSSPAFSTALSVFVASDDSVTRTFSSVPTSNTALIWPSLFCINSLGHLFFSPVNYFKHFFSIK